MLNLKFGLTIAVAVFFLSGCSEDGSIVPSSTLEARNLDASIGQLFNSDAVVGKPKVVPCTLSGGVQTECLSITLSAAPTSFNIGPWCPRHIDDGPDASGIWLHDGQVLDADGAFIQNLPEFFNDDVWQLFDAETGKIKVTDSKISCAAAARPDVAEEYRNHCVECAVSYLEEGLAQTYVIPLQPVAAETVSNRVSRGGVGIAFSGVRLDGPAPVDAILGAHTLAPFDDCGGHINLAVGYHLHAATDCLEHRPTNNDHAPQIGLAMDGYGIHTLLNYDGQEPQDLDVCRGHQTEELGYHYHANAPGENAILTCHRGQTGCALESSDASCDASQTQARRGPPPGGESPPRGTE